MCIRDRPALFSSTLSPALSVYLRECGAAGSASGQTACPVRPILHQSRSRHGNASPLCPSPPLLPVWMNVYFLFPWCWTSLLFDFLSVLFVRGGAVCLLMPPSLFSSLPFKKYFSHPVSSSPFNHHLIQPVLGFLYPSLHFLLSKAKCHI